MQKCIKTPSNWPASSDLSVIMSSEEHSIKITWWASCDKAKDIIFLPLTYKTEKEDCFVS